MPPQVTLVAVGSRNPAKTKGTRAAFAHIFHRIELKAVDAAVGTSVKIQPLSLEETAEGARTRALFALNSAKADFGVGVEAGIVQIGKYHPGHFVNLQIAAVVDSPGRISFGLSSGFPIPAKFAAKLRRDRDELDRYAHDLTGAANVEEEHGVVYHLSGERLSRVQMTEQCVSMALIPWINKKTFFEFS